ncbi:hypothetical protein Lser_V15G07957 [Lactuca serriola]
MVWTNHYNALVAPRAPILSFHITTNVDIGARQSTQVSSTSNQQASENNSTGTLMTTTTVDATVAAPSLPTDTTTVPPFDDTLTIIGSLQKVVNNLICALSSSFPFKDLGRIYYFLGIEVVQNLGGVTLMQHNYALDLLRCAHMVNCKSVSTPISVTEKLAHDYGKALSDDDVFKYRSLVGGLQYLTLTRPNISFAVNKVYWDGCLDYRRSTGGFDVFLGPNFISWSSQKQLMVSRSSIKAEYKAFANCTTKATWVQSLLKEPGVHQSRPPVLWCDNLGATYLTANPVFHARAKHIEVDFHFVCEKVAMCALDVRLSSRD